MSNEQTKTLPTYRVHSVSEGENPTWTEIGAAWPHKDGKGFSLTFTAQALPGSKIVLRVPKAKLSGAAMTRKSVRAAKAEVAQ